ncbi:MAG: hypothetical protein IKQ27_00545 [Lachnospiraceae bacterium]|nr:hypothetical protein [Solobacterium sp.]MBR6155419.1 hypothetical protein [Lachnospiraceae bacterium]
MKNLWKLLCALFCLCTICFVVIHRNVIKAAIKGEPLPEAPEWHKWHHKS